MRPAGGPRNAPGSRPAVRPRPARPQRGKLLWLLAGLLSAQAVGTARASLADKLDAVLRGRGAARVSARVLELPSGRVLYSAHADELMIPASNMKLLITAAALDLLGPDFAFRTILAVRGDDLVVIGDGDPATGDAKLAREQGEPITAMFHRWADALRARGITHIRGDLIFDDSIFDAQWVNPQWPPEDHQKAYAAPVGGLNFNDNCIVATVWPASQPGAPALFELTPRTTLIEIENRCKSGGRGKPVIRRVGQRPRYVLAGRCSKRASLAPVAVPDPGAFFASALRTALAAKGIRIDGRTRRARIRNHDGSLPSDCRLIAEHRTPLASALRLCNKSSQNLFAECLLKRIGYEYARRTGQGEPVGSWTNGRQAVRAFLWKLGIDPIGLVIDDGSGLSRDNRLNARHLTEVLKYMFTHPHAGVFLQSLSVNGVDGTLKRRMTDIKGRVRAKTGYIRGVRTLSGYVTTRAGTTLCFSILFNDIPGGTAPYNRMHDEICRLLWRWQPTPPGRSGP